MSDIENFIDLLPPIELLDPGKISSPLTYIGAVGFEDRSLSVFNIALQSQRSFEQVIAIEYRPINERNKGEEFQKNLDQLNIPGENVEWVVYDRCNPEEFLKYLDIIKEKITLTSNVIVDISAMSKLLIIVLLQGLRDLDVNLTIVYAEADVYHPTREEFETQKEKYKKETENLPIFLTSDVYDIVTTTSLSSTAMQGYPLMMVAFPTFNHRELTALVNEIIPQHLVLLHGKPHEQYNEWRMEAITWLNRRVIERLVNGETLTEQERIISTFDYKETIKVLEKIYQSYKYDKKIVVVPTGSKLQTFGVFLFKQMHPDIQVIYPVTKKFTDLYTGCCKAVWQIPIKSFSDFILQLNGYRKKGLGKLNRAIQHALKKNSKKK
ncbi:MAG: hypothetical protein PVH61_04455 [Candidatus Aminicenantes bacterium]|jgi:hypothetical protein